MERCIQRSDTGSTGGDVGYTPARRGPPKKIPKCLTDALGTYDWNKGELSTMLWYKMRRKGHSKYKETSEMLAQYAVVMNDDSDDES